MMVDSATIVSRRAELAHKAFLFREGAKRIYDNQGGEADMWFFELYHFLGDVCEELKE